MYITCNCNSTILALYQRWQPIFGANQTYEIYQAYHVNFSP
jgi:hypothetical protein